MSGRIGDTFARLKTQNRAALIPFIMGGDPDAQASATLLKALPEAGADIIEIGIPFSDPMADGAVIQAAGLRSLKNGTTLKRILGMAADFRQANDTTPVILMGYYNPIYRYGVEKFCADAADAGVDGMIVVDLPPEEEDEITPHLRHHGLELIRLIAPTSGGGRLKRLSESAGGFVYYISVAGITGAAAASAASLTDKITEIRRHTALPIAIGFGIKTPAQAKEAAMCGDAVVVGSALVDILHHKGSDDAIRFVTALSAAMKRG